MPRQPPRRVQEGRQLALDRVSAQPASGRAGDDDQVETRARKLASAAEPFANMPLHTVTDHCTTYPAAHGQTQPACSINCIRPSYDRQHNEIARRSSSTLLTDASKIPGAPETILSSQTTTLHGSCYLEDIRTASRLRPFARRRFSTRRPPLVLIRARNPWLRLRRIRLG